MAEAVNDLNFVLKIVDGIVKWQRHKYLKYYVPILINKVPAN